MIEVRSHHSCQHQAGDYYHCPCDPELYFNAHPVISLLTIGIDVMKRPATMAVVITPATFGPMAKGRIMHFLFAW